MVLKVYSVEYLAKIVIAILLHFENFLVSRFSFLIRKVKYCVITNHHKTSNARQTLILAFSRLFKVSKTQCLRNTSKIDFLSFRSSSSVFRLDDISLRTLTCKSFTVTISSLRDILLRSSAVSFSTSTVVRCLNQVPNQLIGKNIKSSVNPNELFRFISCWPSNNSLMSQI